MSFAASKNTVVFPLLAGTLKVPSGPVTPKDSPSSVFNFALVMGRPDSASTTRPFAGDRTHADTETHAESARISAMAARCFIFRRTVYYAAIGLQHIHLRWRSFLGPSVFIARCLMVLL
jgi:hypothetical protein